MPFVPLLPTVPEPPAGKIRGNDTKEDHLEMWGQPEVGMADDQEQDEDQFNDGQVSKNPSLWFNYKKSKNDQLKLHFYFNHTTLRV